MSALKNTMYSTVATYVEYFLGLIISIIIARQLGPEQFGIYSYLMWVSALLGVLILSGVSLGGIKFIAEARAKETNDILPVYHYYRKTLAKRIFFFTIISCSMVYFFGAQFIKNIEPKLIYIVIAASIIKSLHWLYISVLKGFEDFQSLAVIATIVSPINIILIIVCYYTKQPLETYLWVYLIVSTTYLLSSYPFISKKIKKQKAQSAPINPSLMKRITQHTWVAGSISVIGFIVMRQSELFFLNIYSTAEEMAFYNVSFSLAFAGMSLVPGVYSSILLPLMARENKEGKNRGIEQLKVSIRYMFQLVITLVFPVCFFAEEIFSFLYGEQYMGAVTPFRIIMACVSFKALLDCTNAYLWSTDRQMVLFKLYIITAILTLSLDYFLIKEFQLTGALMAYAISTSFMVLAYFYILVKTLNVKLEWKKYIQTIISAVISILFVSPLGYYMPTIYGTIIGGIGFIVIYIIMLLFTLSFSSKDIALFRKLNQYFFSFFDRSLINLQNRTKIKV